jgi:uncharacterized integral membrane protein
MEEPQTHHEEAQPPAPAKRSRRWIGPAIYLTVILVPVLILIFSNTGSTDIRFAGFERGAPLWIILAITFFAGAIVTRPMLWVWRAIWRRKTPAA